MATDKDNKKQKHKEWREKNKERLKEYKKEWHQNNKVENIQRIKEWNKQNKEKTKQYKKKWRESNKEYKRKRRESEPLFKLKENIVVLIRTGFKKQGWTKKSKTQTILGCSFEEFKQHIEAQFEPWMNWDNGPKPYSETERTWQTDHVIPASFAKTEEEMIKLNHYTNLRPYCSYKNISEGNRR